MDDTTHYGTKSSCLVGALLVQILGAFIYHEGPCVPSTSSIKFLPAPQPNSVVSLPVQVMNFTTAGCSIRCNHVVKPKSCFMCGRFPLRTTQRLSKTRYPQLFGRSCRFYGVNFGVAELRRLMTPARVGDIGLIGRWQRKASNLLWVEVNVPGLVVRSTRLSLSWSASDSRKLALLYGDRAIFFAG